MLNAYRMTQVQLKKQILFSLEAIDSCFFLINKNPEENFDREKEILSNLKTKLLNKLTAET